jgi:tetratricopeptide (TPR) repeat protein
VADSLIARLDRLGEGKRIVQLAATIGRTFALPMLLEVAGVEESALLRELQRLQSAGLVLRMSETDEESYIFKHALIQDAAYGSLLRATRQDYHRQIVRALQAKSPNLATSQPELLARHFQGAGMTTEAVAQWSIAGQKAIARSANIEAISALGRSLHLLSTLPPSEQRDRQEIELRCSLGLALISAKGWSAKEVEDTYGPAHELCRAYGDVPTRVLYGLWAVAIVRADRKRTETLIPRWERTIRESSDRHARLMSHSALSAHGFYSGKFEDAVRHGGEGSALLDRSHPRKQTLELFAQGFDGQLYPVLFKAWARIYQGRARDAFATIEEGVAVARETGHPFLLALALSFGAAVSHDAGNTDMVQSRGRQLADVAAENAFPFFSAWAKSFLGWAALKSGERDKGVEMMRQAVGFYRAVGSDVVLAYYLSYVAEGFLDREHADEGLTLVNEALRVTETCLSVFYAAELYRLRGEFLRLKDDMHGAERQFQSAVSLADSQQCPLLKARAMLSLARLYVELGRTADAAAVRRIPTNIAPEEPLAEVAALAALDPDVGGA